MKKEPIIVNVYLWGTCIGKLNWDFEKHCSVFQFTDEYRKQDYDICPSTHPKRTPLFASFYGNKDKLYQGLPEFLADALPDKWGVENIKSLDPLLYSHLTHQKYIRIK